MTSLLSDVPKWEGDIPARPLKVAVIREELVALTGDPLIAVVLNQLLYWTQRVKDFDLLLREEIKRNPECNVPFRHGWIYKSADELTNETMLCISRSTMRRYLSFLIDKGWVDERTNSHDKWNKTTQYRLNLRKLQSDLYAIGYCLPGFSLPLKEHHGVLLKPAELSNGQNETSKEQNKTSMFQNGTFIYLNRDYTEIKNRDHTQSAREINEISFEGDTYLETPELPLTPPLEEEGGTRAEGRGSIPEEMAELWKRHIGQEKIHLTQDRARLLEFLLSVFFQNEVREWERFCERVKASDFLMGQGANKWHVTFDWILVKGNVLKVLEGNYDNPEKVEQKKAHSLQQNRDQEIRKILNTIEDAQWKYWCTQLSRRDSVSLGELKAISQARFVEFDERLVWIESSDPKTLSHIEDSRLMILPVIKQTYPTARNLRTQREEREHGKSKALSSHHGAQQTGEEEAEKERPAILSSFLPPQYLGKANIPLHINSEELTLSHDFPFTQKLPLPLILNPTQEN